MDHGTARAAATTDEVVVTLHKNNRNITTSKVVTAREKNPNITTRSVAHGG
jgi:hypothetical protein